MTTEIIMPQGGQDIVVGKVVRWLRAEGDHVAEGDILCEIETEKAVFEVNSPCEGYLRRILVKEGEEASILSVIGYLGGLEEDVPTSVQREERTDNVGTRVAPPREGPDVASGLGGLEGVPVSPRARRLADEKEVPLSIIKGTGAGGRITEKDVLAFIERRAEQSVASSTDQVAGGRIVPMSKVQGATARRMQESKQTVPHFYLTSSVDMSKAMKYRGELSSRRNDPGAEQVSVTDLVIRACVIAFRENPKLNSSVLDGQRIVLWEDLNIGLAVAVGDELVVPVIESIHLHSLEGIARERARVVARAREGKQSSLAPARFTISNLGMFGVDQFLPIINPPETAILGISSIEKSQIVMSEDTVCVRDMVSLSLSVDHRAINGVVACRFLQAVKTALENPASLG